MNRFSVFFPLSIFLFFSIPTVQSQTWVKQNAPSAITLYSVHFVDNQTGWAVGIGGTILKTTNGGQNWTTQISGTTQFLHKVQFINSQVGWAVGDSGTVLKTTNSGLNWVKQVSGTSLRLLNFFFMDSQTGWAVGEANGISPGVNVIIKSTNGGQTWVAETPNSISFLYDVHFVNSLNGWIVGQGGTILKTINGGQNWTPQTSGTTNWLVATRFYDTQTGWAVGQKGTVLKTSNGGVNWTSQTLDSTKWLRGIHFIDNQTGWIVGDTGVIYKTTNGGQNWVLQTSGVTDRLNAVYFSDSQTGFIVGMIGRILATCIPPSVSITAPTQTLCNGSTVLLTANTAETGLQYQWSRNGTNITNATQATYSANQAGQYAVKVTRANGCDSTATLFIKPPILVDSGLVAYYPFDGDALDYSGNGNHGTISGNITYDKDRFGNNNKVAKFGIVGNEGRIQIPNSNSLKFTNAGSFSSWVLLDSLVSNNNYARCIFAKDYDQSNLLNGLISSNISNNTFNIFSSFIGQNANPTGHQLKKWIQVTFVFDLTQSNIKIYFNGILVGSNTVTLNFTNSNSRDLFLGAFRDGLYPLHGSLDDIRIYNRALTAAEIQLLYKPATYNFARCTGDTLKLTAPSVSGVSYTWKKGTTTLGTGTVFSKNDIALADTGTYNLDISYKGCTFSDTTVVNSIKTKPSVTLNDTSICAGSSAYLQVPTGFSNYKWSVGSSTSATNTITPLSTQPVSVTVTNVNGCTASATATITVLPASLNCGLVAHYKLDGNARDTSGNGNHGTPVGGVTWTKDRFGNCNSAASFDGVNDWITIPDNSLMRPNLVTVTAWVKRASLAVEATNIFYKQPYEVYSLDAISFHIKQNSGCAYLNGTGWQNTTAINTQQISQWYFVVGVFDGSSLSFYQNGVLVSQNTNLPKTVIDNCAGGDFRIGRWHDASPSQFFKGDLDDIRIYNRALSATEITQLFNQAETTVAPPSVSITAPTQTLCNGSTVLLTANTAETGLQYQWSRNGTNITNAAQTTYSANQAGQYAVKVSRANGCDSTATLFIKPPILVDSGLVAYYPFDGDALDYSGNGNHGTVNGATLTTDRLGNASKAYSFNGINNYINIGDKVDPAEFTLSAWIQVAGNNNSSSFETIISKLNGDFTFRNFEFRVDPNRQIIVHIPNSTDGWVALTSPNSINYNQWYFVSVTWDSNIAKLYINTSLITTRVLPRYDRMLGDVLIGARPGYVASNAVESFFNGKMDDIRIYNRALTAAEIQLLYKPATYNFARCAGDTLKLTAPSVSGVSYTWKKGTTTLGTGTVFSKNNIALADTGTYNLDISYKGCTFSDTTVVNSIKARPSVTLNDTSICAGSSAYLQVPTGFSTYQWSVGTSTSATNTITPLSTQPVSVTVTNANGCTASATATITVLPASLNCGLVAHYKLDGNAADSSWNGNHGTPVGGVTWAKDRFGNCNSAANLDGKDDYITTPLYQRNLTEYSVSTWVNLSRQSRSTIWAARGAIEPGCVGVSRSLSCEIEASGKVAFALDGNNLLIGKRTAININPNQWYHIVGVFKGNLGQNALPSQFSIYVNGVLQFGATDININYCGSANTYPTPYTGLGNVTLGYNEAWFNDTASIFDGKLNDIRIYNRALSTTEVQQIYQIQETGKRPPSAQITNSPPSVCAGSTTLLNASPTGSGFQYQWFKDSVLIANATAATYSTGQAGRYQVRVTDATGCDSLSVATTVTVNPLPVPDASNDTAICQNSTAKLWIKNNTTNFRSYTWSTTPTTTTATANVTPSVSTKYFVTVTDANGCSGKDSVTITVNQNPKPLVNDTTICSGSTVTLWTRNASANFRNYNWTNAAGTSVSTNTSFTNTPSVSTNFYLNVTDANGCMGKDTATITVNTIPNISFSGNQTLCVGQSTQLKASGGTTYRWSNAATKDTTTVSPTTTTWYLITVTNASGCAKTDSVRVVVNAVPTPAITGNPLFCKGLTTNLTASGGTSYRWQTGATANQIGINQAGTYTVTVTNANNCSATKSIDVTARTLVSSAAITDIVCYGQKTGRIAATISTIGTANTPYTFTWSGNVGTPTNIANSTIVNTLSAGSYPLSIRDVDGCRLDTSFTIRQPDSLKITVSSLKNENCSVGNNGQITLTATGGTPPLQYLWSRSAQDIQPTITNLQQGIYTLTVTDAAQCTKNQSFTIDLTKDNLPAPTVSVANSTTSSITFSWSSVSNANRYEVKIKDSVWMAPNGNLQHTVSGLGELETIDFKVRAVSSNPLCANALIGNIEGTTKEKPIDESCLEAIKNNIPNAFSPNDDGENDIFDPQQYFSISGCPVRLKAERLIIVNQWGEIIWEANPYMAWEGRSGKAEKPVPESAYFYVLVLRVNGRERLIRGAINVFTDK